jgi:voltage-gated potassium channel
MENENRKTTKSPTAEEIGRRNTIYELFILVLTILSLLVAVSLLVLPVAEVTNRYLVGVDVVLCVVFLADFLGSLYSASDKRAYLVKGGWLELGGSIPALPILRFGRLARAVRAVRNIRGRRLRDVEREFSGNRARSALLVTALVAILVIALAGNVVLFFEKDAAGANILTGEDAFWWTFVTITTVGYGDYFPVTDGGRATAMLIMTVGIGFFTVLTGYLATNFLSRRREMVGREEADGTATMDQIAAVRDQLETDIADVKSELITVNRSLETLEQLIQAREREDAG